MADPDLDRLEALARAATPGPWSNRWDDARGTRRVANVRQLGEDSGWVIAQCQHFGKYANADFITACHPAAILALLARLRAAEADLAAERERCARIAEDAERRSEGPVCAYIAARCRGG